MKKTLTPKAIKALRAIAFLAQDNDDPQLLRLIQILAEELGADFSK
jgi:hypothetical protein